MKKWNVLIDLLSSPVYAYPATSALKEAGAPALQVLETLPTVMHTDGGFVMDWVSAGPEGVKASVSPAKLVNGPSTETCLQSPWVTVKVWRSGYPARVLMDYNTGIVCAPRRTRMSCLAAGDAG